MLLYHPDSTEPVTCHPTQVDVMKSNGWVETLSKTTKPEATQTNSKSRRS